jgi:putative transposase
MVIIRRLQMGKQGIMDTIWEVPDELWEQVGPVLLELDPPKATGRRRVDQRRMLNGIIFRMRSGCQWNRLPKQLGDDSTVHRTFQRWVERGVFTRVWAMLVQCCEELDGVDWEWQAADAAMGKARLGGTRLARTPQTGANPEARGASWWKGEVAH